MNSATERPQPFELKLLLDNLNFPVLFSNIISFWENLTMDVWKNEFRDNKLPFRRGYKIKCKCEKRHPQWERFHDTVHLTFDDFVNISKKDDTYWYYFDYKELLEWATSDSNVWQNISWSEFGFPESTSSDTMVWIGSKGAHTPCHVDTYENNLVLQVYGEKKWYLFSPDTNLKPTRIPYEESSIYSKIDFYQPDLNEFTDISGGFEIVLKPGDVLFVPQGWWHYVENITDIAISVNVWVPSVNQQEMLRHESVIQLLMAQVTKNLPESYRKHVLNPNNECITSESLATLLYRIKMFNNNRSDFESNVPPESKKIKLESTSQSELLKKYSTFIKQLTPLSESELKQSLLKSELKLTTENLKFACNIVDTESATDEENFDIKFLNKFLNALCDSDVIKLIWNKISHS